MFKDKHGIVWSSEAQYKSYDKQHDFIFNSALALESFTDEKAIKDEEIKVAYNDCMKMRKTFQTGEELMKETERLVEKFNSIFDRVGREKFVFSKNGGVEYLWEYSKNRNGKKVF